MACVVVVGMHRSGTSLLTSILLDLGVHIGDELLMRGRMQPHGHWEDMDFFRLNRHILSKAGGRWNTPPSRAAILKVRGDFNAQIRKLVARKDKRKLWGWKDPRTSLTAELYHPHLVSPRYLRIIRGRDAVLRSLQKRHKGGEWGNLYDVYTSRATEFLTGKPHLVVAYESLVDIKTRQGEIKRVNDWVGGNGRIEIAMERVK